jgi:hypothetical protein
MSAVKEYLQWRRGPAVGCVFARLMSSVPTDYGQIVEEVTHRDVGAVAATIADRVQQLIPIRRALAAAFVSPGVKALEDLLAMALALKSNSSWHVDVWKLAPPPEMDLAAVKVTRDLPFGSGTLPSEALALGNFPEFPNTRRAPQTAFEIYVGEPAPQDPKEHTPSTKANFAHIDLRDRELINGDFEQKNIDGMWVKSKEGRLRSLGGVEDARAKAKVTFVVPIALATRMGCLS